MKRKAPYYLIIILLSVLYFACEKEKSGLISKAQEREFGRQLDSAILSNPAEYPVLSEASHPEAYAFMNNMMNNILGSTYLNRAEYFNWTLRIIDDDVLNAFAAPGGYMYYYTGLMKYLDNEAQLAGVMAHEITHIDRRHAAQQLERQMAFSVIVSVILGKNPSKLEEFAAGLAQGLSSLAFSRKHEYEADEYAVKHTSETEYDPRGISGFFIKLEEAKSVRMPEFLNTHPDPGNRLEAINNVWISINSPTGELYEQEYEDFLDLLP